MNRVWLCTIVWLAGSSSYAWAQKPNPGKYSTEKYPAKSARGYLVAMRDGVNLSVDIYQPDAPGAGSEHLGLVRC